MNSKRTDQKTLEELLDIIDSDDAPEDTLVDQSEDEILRFIGQFNIVAGTEYVASRILHRLYSTMFENPMKLGRFSEELNLYFERTQTGQFRINRSALDIGKDLDKILRDKKTKSTGKRYTQHFNNFQKSLNILPGADYVTMGTLYFIYDDWCYNVRRTKPYMSESTFIAFCKMILKIKRLENGKAYAGINKKELNYELNDEKQRTIDQWQRKRYSNTINKTKGKQKK